MPDIFVLIWNRGGTHALVPNAVSPRISLGTRWTDGPPAVVTAGVRDQLGLDVDLVRVGGAGDVEVQCRGPVVGENDAQRWVRRSMWPAADQRPAWQCPGWIERVEAEVDREIAAIGVTRTGEVRQARHTSVTGMLVVPTTAGELWLKTGLPMFSHEGRLTRWIAAGPGAGSVPEVCAATDEWWLSADFTAGTRAGQPDGDPLVSLAEIQIAALDRVGELRELGVPARGVGNGVDRLETAVGGSEFLGTEGTDALGAALEPLRRARDELHEVGVPDTVVHGDLTPRNVWWTGKSWLLYDWTDGCVGTPFADLAVATMDDGDAVRARRVRRYAEPWRRHLSRTAVATALRTAPLVGAAHQVASYLEILAGMERTGGDQANGAEMSRLLAYWTDRLDRIVRAGATEPKFR